METEVIITSERKLFLELQKFSLASNLSLHKIGIMAVNDAHLARRLKGGHTLTVRNMDKIYRFMNEYRSENVINTS